MPKITMILGNPMVKLGRIKLLNQARQPPGLVCCACCLLFCLVLLWESEYTWAKPDSIDDGKTAQGMAASLHLTHWQRGESIGKLLSPGFLMPNEHRFSSCAFALGKLCIWLKTVCRDLQIKLCCRQLIHQCDEMCMWNTLSKEWVTWHLELEWAYRQCQVGLMLRGLPLERRWDSGDYLRVPQHSTEFVEKDCKLILKFIMETNDYFPFGFWK